MTQPCSLPVPTTEGETAARFVMLLTGPDFASYQKVVRYRITLEMVFDTLRQGIAQQAGRTRKEEALALYGQCVTELDAVRRCFETGNVGEAHRLALVAQKTFRQAGKARRTPPAARP